MRNIECLRSVTSNILRFVPEFEQRNGLKASRVKSGSRKQESIKLSLGQSGIYYDTFNRELCTSQVTYSILQYHYKLVNWILFWVSLNGIIFFIKGNDAVSIWHLEIFSTTQLLLPSAKHLDKVILPFTLIDINRSHLQVNLPCTACFPMPIHQANEQSVSVMLHCRLNESLDIRCSLCECQQTNSQMGPICPVLQPDFQVVTNIHVQLVVAKEFRS